MSAQAVLLDLLMESYGTTNGKALKLLLDTIEGSGDAAAGLMDLYMCLKASTGMMPRFFRPRMEEWGPVDSMSGSIEATMKIFIYDSPPNRIFEDIL